MTIKERRHHQRINALNLISYSCNNESDQIVAQGMGRTLNISEGGILLETHVSMDPKNSVLLAIGLEDELVNIKAKVVYSKGGKHDKFEAGIEFLETDDTTIEILRKYIQAFSTRNK